MEENMNYQRVAAAIEYLYGHFKRQPSLEEVAEHVHLSPAHFQRIFSEWAGVSPKKFLQHISIDFLKAKLQEVRNIQEAADLAGLSAQSRVYDLFVHIEGVTPQAYKEQGKGIAIGYGFQPTPFGECLIGLTERGVCHLAFCDAGMREGAWIEFQQQWQGAVLVADPSGTMAVARQIFGGLGQVPIHLWLRGTPFQLKVWEALLNIPTGSVTTYQQLAEAIGHPKATRAVGTAVGSNPVGFLIPCHRVIRKDGLLADYRWGSARKKAILGMEMVNGLIKQ